MEKYFTLNELAVMTGLTERTLRTYLKMDLLSGEKVDGIWRFSEEELDMFISHKMVKPSIQAKKNAIVYDFMRETKKMRNEMCMILDVTDKDSKAISNFFSAKANEINGAFHFSFEAEGHRCRVILRGEEKVVMRILEEYYC